METSKSIVSTLRATHHSFFNNNHFIHLSTSHGIPMIASKTIVQTSQKMIRQMTFPIDVEQDTGLHLFVTDLERQVKQILLSMDESLLNKLPYEYQSAILEFRDNPEANADSILRPTYRPSNETGKLCAWLQSNKSTVTMKTWDGRLINSINDLDVGDYQFIVKAATIYFGRHGDHPAIANLVVRVCALRYRTRDVTSAAGNAMDWNYNNDEPAQQQLPNGLVTKPLNYGSNVCASYKEDQKCNTSNQQESKKRGRKPLTKLVIPPNSNPEFTYIEETTMMHAPE